MIKFFIAQIKNFWKTILCIVIIFILSFIPGKALDKFDLFDFKFQDLIVHFIMYAFFTYIFIKDLSLLKKSYFNQKRWWLVPLIVSLTIGLVTELTQWLFIPGRNGNILDFVINLSGTGTIILSFRNFK
ncbi:MAG: VanZ family protein [Candidatus Woesearchaeota archaeon]